MKGSPLVASRSAEQSPPIRPCQSQNATPMSAATRRCTSRTTASDGGGARRPSALQPFMTPLRSASGAPRIISEAAGASLRSRTICPRSSASQARGSRLSSNPSLVPNARTISAGRQAASSRATTCWSRAARSRSVAPTTPRLDSSTPGDRLVRRTSYRVRTSSSARSSSCRRLRSASRATQRASPKVTVQRASSAITSRRPGPSPHRPICTRPGETASRRTVRALPDWTVRACTPVNPTPART